MNEIVGPRTDIVSSPFAATVASSLCGTRTHTHPSGHRLSLRTRVHLLYPPTNIFFALPLQLGDPSSDRQWLTGQWLSYPSSNNVHCVARSKGDTSPKEDDINFRLWWLVIISLSRSWPAWGSTIQSYINSPQLFWCPSFSLSLGMFTPKSVKHPSEIHPSQHIAARINPSESIWTVQLKNHEQSEAPVVSLGYGF
jgi:hypothetical protein